MKEEISLVTILEIHGEKALILLNNQKYWATVQNNTLKKGSSQLVSVKKREHRLIIAPLATDKQDDSQASLNIVI